MEGKSPGEEDLGHVPVLVIFLREKKELWTYKQSHPMPALKQN